MEFVPLRLHFPDPGPLIRQFLLQERYQILCGVPLPLTEALVLRSCPDIRQLDFHLLKLHYEIGDCTFAQIVRIRDLRARGKPLDKTDQDWYNRNRRLVDFKRKYTEQDEEKFSKWLR